MCLFVQAGYLLNPQLLWEQYPHTDMPLSLKFYMLTQVTTTQLLLRLISSLNCHNLNSMDPILRFSESLERDLSNDVIKIMVIFER